MNRSKRRKRSEERKEKEVLTGLSSFVGFVTFCSKNRISTSLEPYE